MQTNDGNFKSGQEMLCAIQNGATLYDAETGRYVFKFPDTDSVAVMTMTAEEAKRIRGLAAASKLPWYKTLAWPRRSCVVYESARRYRTNGFDLPDDATRDSLGWLTALGFCRESYKQTWTIETREVARK